MKTTSIAENLELLKKFNFDLTKIYNLDITDWQISLHAYKSVENLIYFQNLGYKFILNNQGYAIFESEQLRIVLT